MNRIRVMIADDHQILAEGVRTMLEQEFEVVDVVCNGQELVFSATLHRPDVIVADITMPSLNDIDAAIQLRNSGVTSKVVFLTMHRDVAYARRAIEAGASGYVLKHSVSSELITAVRDAVAGRTYISPMIAGELLHSYTNGDFASDRSPARLTARQIEVLRLIANGSSAKEVASLLKISVRTAEAHRANILANLEMQSTAELVQYAIRHGIVSVD